MHVNDVADCVVIPPFKVYNEKFKGATYIIVFDGVCQFFTSFRHHTWSKVQYWQLIDIPRPISSYCFYKDI